MSCRLLLLLTLTAACSVDQTGLGSSEVRIDAGADAQSTECIGSEQRECGPAAIGLCRRGLQSCIAGTWGPCEGAVGPTTEVCDPEPAEDEDCDGVVNNGCACTPGTSQVCGIQEGECTLGTATCDDNGVFGECTGVAPVEENDARCNRDRRFICESVR